MNSGERATNYLTRAGIKKNEPGYFKAWGKLFQYYGKLVFSEKATNTEKKDKYFVAAGELKKQADQEIKKIKSAAPAVVTKKVVIPTTIHPSFPEVITKPKPVVVTKKVVILTTIHPSFPEVITKPKIVVAAKPVIPKSTVIEEIEKPIEKEVVKMIPDPAFESGIRPPESTVVTIMRNGNGGTPTEAPGFLKKNAVLIIAIVAIYFFVS